MEELKKGQEIFFQNGKKATVVKKLGAGGQGAVYEVMLDGKHYALKWYLRDYLKRINQKKFYDNLLDNQKSGSPSKKFLWPLEVSEYRENSFGYLMDIRPKSYRDFSQILNAKVKFKSVKVAITAAKNICEAFQSLHKEGY
ncbi:MAG: serine/threonine protein kinase, partial [Clostridia bacterium]|nr:serine/threonine protein kinase [Clostridia bacterium]